MLERPTILVVDDELAAVASMLDALTRRFGGEDRVEPHLSARGALDAIVINPNLQKHRFGRLLHAGRDKRWACNASNLGRV